MSQITKKFIGNDQVDGTKIHLDNNQAIRSRNAANSADVDIIKLDASDVVQIAGDLHASGNMSAANLSGTNTGDLTLAAVGSTPSADGASLSGQVLTLQPADASNPGLLTAGTQTIGGAKTFSVIPTTLADATTANQLVRYSQLSALTDGLKPKAAVVVASTGNIDLSVAADPNPIDGYTIANGDRVLLWQQTADAENGIYIATTATDPTTWVRSSDFDMPSEIPGAYTVAEFGTLYQGSVFVCLSSPGTIGTDPINFAQRSFSAGANTALSNLASTAVNASIIPASNNAIKLGDYGLGYSQVLSEQYFSTGSSASFGSASIDGGPDTAGQSVGLGADATGLNSNANGGDVTVSTQTTTGSGLSGTVYLRTGASAADSGSVILNIGTAGGTRGKIQFVDGSEGTSGYIWTSTDSSGNGHWQAPASAPANNKELVVLSGTDITNQYVDLAHVAKTNSILFQVQGQGSQFEGASYDYSVSYTGGAGGNTRITFLNGLATGGASALVAGNVVETKYQY